MPRCPRGMENDRANRFKIGEMRCLCLLGDRMFHEFESNTFM